MNKKQLEYLNIMSRMIKAWIPNCRTEAQIHFFEELLSLIKDIKREDSEPCVLAIPMSEDVTRYNIAELYEYCKANHIVPSELSREEKEMFVIK